MIERILVPMDFTPRSDAALDYALAVAEACGAEVQVLHVWAPTDRTIFAETPQGLAMERRLTAAEHDHDGRVSGRLEFGDEPSRVILAILHDEPFDLVVMGGDAMGATSGRVALGSPCAVVTMP